MPKNLYQNLPDSPGVYLMRNAKGELLYVGKAGNLKRRVSSYFQRPHEYRIQKLVSEIAQIDFEKTDTAIEALILEAKLIKQHEPPFNVREKDDTSFLCVAITREKFPRVLLIRNKDTEHSPLYATRYGPFTDAGSLREAMRILRRIFPYSTHPPEEIGKLKRPCFNAQIGLCPGTCVGAISTLDYRKTINRLKLFFEGKKKQIIRDLNKEMVAASRTQEYEVAERARRQIFALQHIQDVAFIRENEVAETQNIKHRTQNIGSESKLFYVPGSVLREPRIEGYDISNISGTSAVGSMVVFRGDKPDKNEYRKFKIRTIEGANDVGMLREVLIRRFRRIPAVRSTLSAQRSEWPLPQLILIDGGVAQVNAARSILHAHNLKIPVVGLAKGPKRKRNDLIGTVPAGITLNTLERVRDEAHRFAIGYHKKLRGARSLN